MSTTKQTLGARLFKARMELALGTAPADGGGEELQPLPPYVMFQLARLRLLHDMPFHYLVPDARLLPDESIRFFTLDDAWLDKLVEGTLSAVCNGSRELARARSAAQSAIAGSSRLRYGVRKVELGRLSFDLAVDGDTHVGPGSVSGFMLRSKLVSQWPNLNLRAWASKDVADIPLGADPAQLEADRPELVVPILRMERLAPSLLLALFDGVPEMLWLEEPHSAVQFGVEGGMVRIRDQQGKDIEPPKDLPLPMRQGAIGGVVDIENLTTLLDQQRPLAHPRGSGALAMQLLRAPTRQRFGS